MNPSHLPHSDVTLGFRSKPCDDVLGTCTRFEHTPSSHLFLQRPSTHKSQSISDAQPSGSARPLPLPQVSSSRFLMQKTTDDGPTREYYPYPYKTEKINKKAKKKALFTMEPHRICCGAISPCIIILISAGRCPLWNLSLTPWLLALAFFYL